ncbi:DNA primase [Leptolyngbya sp. 15MV]|nr:DNA primase [Leptolyngbya sp. 15MV]
MAAAFRPSEDKERVREASDIVRVIGEHVALKPRGREFVGLCPFHDDHKPSMWVSPAKGIYKCFSCGAGGDVFTFVQNYHSMEFRDALEYLAQRAGIELSRHKPHLGDPASHDTPPDIDRKALLRANATALDFFRAILAHPEHGQTSRDIITRRQIAPEMVERFALGAAPDRWDGLLLTLQKQGTDPAPFVAAGLLKRRDSGPGLYDALRHRLIFPIHDQLGRVIAFGGRKIRDEDEPKYLNSPETPLFDKSATLYGLHQAARDIQRARVALITEGYTETIAGNVRRAGHARAGNPACPVSPRPACR